MDINTPNMNGIEATQHIRRFEQDNRIGRALIIAISGLGEHELRQHSVASHIDHFLLKPVQFRHLEDLLVDCRATKSLAQH